MLCHRFQYSKAQTNKNPIDFILCYHYYSGDCFQHTEYLQISLGATEHLAKAQQNRTFCHSITFHMKGPLHKKVLMIFLHKSEEAVLLDGEVPHQPCAVSGEPWSCICTSVMGFGQGWVGRSEHWHQHTLVQLCNISLETMQRFISLSRSPSLWSSKFKFPVVLLAIFRAVFWLQAIYSLPSLHFLYGLLYVKV